MLAKTTKKIKRVAFFGDAEAKETDQHFIDAYETAKILAENGFIVVSGGGPGIMRASTLGAKAGNGRVEVVILDPTKEPNNYEGIDEKTIKDFDLVIKTESYSDRVNKLVEIADAFVIFKGGAGTLSEMGLIWETAKFDYGHHEPLIFFGGCWEELIPEMVKELGLDQIEQNVYTIVKKPEEVLEVLSQVGSYT